MKLVNYKLQSQIELLTEQKSNTYFKDYLKSILEDDTRPYYAKADYIGLSLNELKNKIDYLADDIKELQAYKKRLSSSLDIAKEQTAKVFISNGVTRIDGNIISSITLSKATTKTKDTLVIKDEQALMNLGYVKFELDTEAIEETLKTIEGKKELNEFVSISSQTVYTPSKVKINTKKISINLSMDDIVNSKNQQVA